MFVQKDDYQALSQAAQQLEASNLATKISHVIGIPIEKTLAALPGHWSTIVTRSTQSALEKALDGALFTLGTTKRKPSNTIHKFMVGISGAVGGSLGIIALAAELPVSATIMLRSIAEIARDEGESPEDMETKIACLEVFALSGGSNKADSADTSYYAVRSFLTKALGDTSKHLLSKGLAKEGAPALVKLVNAVSSRFSISVSEKIAAQSIPVLGAAGGASVNLIFISHFQAMAKAHFTVRRLERKYGKNTVEETYKSIVREQQIQHKVA